MAAFGALLLRTTTSATSRALSRNAKGAARQCRERCGAAAAASAARAAAAPSVAALQHLERRRGISSTARACHGDHEEGFEHAQTVQITWENKDGLKKTTAKCGMNLMRVAHKHGIDLEGACEGVCACSTCHVIMSNEVFDQLPEASEDEEDMLDLAFGLTETSRLGCQVIVTPEMDGIVVKLPAATRNFYVDGHVPQPH
ncbi:conserved unknown protein [Ectocarpus siliculosus]|uniref:2Fe-2S ferredoxin-type domain-containing protein n=1 Tax=Ectocarpus siliculosus TaxID=2880 RepID=D8LDL2_ECTSI|nr:conserved unknown protein [Ectocarpus siliculosus]|eukprot:CBN74086.1 conserved unknown protein [Ectocarpus siliculosus]